MKLCNYINIKTSFTDDIRRFKLQDNICYNELVEIFKKMYEDFDTKICQIKYRDDEGDMVKKKKKIFSFFF